ncbi:hypothetical protein SAMN05660748_4498 [Blastococcus aggregatus]|uniref:Uncharacterized protein n=1 Tax=Blastococcus aggregatus TaxID=38502 RepID=A0A285VHL1_9ACTN|nr:hypothetical protein [Blastococcus aggregatus]SOC53565.1 hypothetical protein SAMN05660748_4498 [Blastococcus aggregatus]
MPKNCSGVLPLRLRAVVLLVAMEDLKLKPYGNPAQRLAFEQKRIGNYRRILDRLHGRRLIKYIATSRRAVLSR